MFDLSKQSAISALVALTGCTAAFLVPQDAFAFQRHAAPQVHVSHVSAPRVSRPAFHQVVHQRPTRVARPARQFTRPSFASHHSSGGSSHRASNFGGRVSHPSHFNPSHGGNFASHLPHGGNQGIQVSHPGTFGGNPSHVGNQASHFPQPGSLGSAARPGSFASHLPQPGSLGSSAAHPGNFASHLPQPGSLGRSAAHPGNFASHLPQPGSLGSSAAHPGNFASHLPQPGSPGSSAAHPGNFASHLPQPGGLGSKLPHAGGLAQNTAAPKTQQLASLGGSGLKTHELVNTHDLVNTHAGAGQHAGGLAGAAEQFGAAKEKEKEANQKLNAAEAGLKNDSAKLSKADQVSTNANKDVGDKTAAEAAAFKKDDAALNKLNADKAGHAPPAIIAADQAALIGATKAASAASTATQKAQTAAKAAQANVAADKTKVAGDQAGVAQDKSAVAADKKDEAQAKQTLADKTKIAKENQQIQNLKTQLANAGNQGASDSGQAPSDDSQASSGSGQSSGGGASSSNNDNSSGSSTPSSSSSASSSSAASSRSTAATRPVALAAVQPTQQPDVSAPQLSPETGPVAGAAAPTEPTATTPGPRFVFVAFQANIAPADRTTFLQAYNASIVGPPAANGVYKLKLADNFPADQMPQLIESMKSQSAYVANVSVAGAAAPTEPAATTPGPRFVFVAFQANISPADLTTFLQAYNVSIVDPPAADGVYKLKLADDFPADQMPQLIESMKSQSAYVADASVN